MGILIVPLDPQVYRTDEGLVLAPVLDGRMQDHLEVGVHMLVKWRV